MAKKIRFALEMEDGVEVRSIDELKECFSIDRVLMYLLNGKLTVWLRDRYLDEIAEAVETLNREDTDLKRKLCEIFDVEYDETNEVDLEEIAERNRKIALLKEYTSEKRYIDVIEQVAFAQDDLYDLLDDGEKVIYLCGEKFHIPLSVKNMKYYGINNPIVVIDSKKEVEWEKLGIALTDVKYDEKYQALLNKKEEEKNILLTAKEKEPAYKIIQKKIFEKDFEKYGVRSYWEDEKGQKCTVFPMLISAKTKEEIKKDVVEFVEDEEKVYFLCGVGFTEEYGVYADRAGIYDKKTKEKVLYSLEKNIKEEFMLTRINVWPKKKNISITEKKIYSFKEKGLYQSNHDGTGLTRIYGIQPIKAGSNNYEREVHSVYIEKDIFYYVKENGDDRGFVFPYNGSFTFCVFDMKKGKEEILHSKIKHIVIKDNFMYLFEEKENSTDIYQLEIASYKLIKVLSININNIGTSYVKNDHLMYKCYGNNHQDGRIAEIHADYGILSKENFELAGFGKAELEPVDLQQVKKEKEQYHVELTLTS